MPLFSRARSRSSASDNTTGGDAATVSGGAIGRHDKGSESQGNGEGDRLREDTEASSSAMETSADEAGGMCGMFAVRRKTGIII